MGLFDMPAITRLPQFLPYPPVNVSIDSPVNVSAENLACYICMEESTEPFVAHEEFNKKGILQSRLLHHVHLVCLKKAITKKDYCPECKITIDASNLRSKVENLQTLISHGNPKGVFTASFVLASSKLIAEIVLPYKFALLVTIWVAYQIFKSITARIPDNKIFPGTVIIVALGIYFGSPASYLVDMINGFVPGYIFDTGMRHRVMSGVCYGALTGAAIWVSFPGISLKTLAVCCSVIGGVIKKRQMIHINS
ncbi:MAG: hypothetical protein H0X51_01890 [Parachlamydiaceae bacterium]|nr:hypothetical protein [Parachlamydiaceae bacterium]